MRLLLVWLAMILCLCLRIISQADRYTSPDSHAYLYKAQNITKHQRGFVTFESKRMGRHEVPSANWPIGYSFFIHMANSITGSSYLWASKLVNFVFLSLALAILYRWYKQEAWFVALAFFSYCSMEIFSHTWSEGPFLFFVILLAYWLHKDSRRGPPRWRWAHVSLILVGMFLLRYAGLIYFIILGGLVIYYFLNKKQVLSRHYLLGLVVASIAVALYLIYNRAVSGGLFGAHHIDVSPLSLGDMLMVYMNTITFPRILVDLSDGIFYWVSGLQLVLVLIGAQVLYKAGELKVPMTAKPLIGMSLFYMGIISLLKLLIAAIDFDYRMFSPFSVVLFLGILASVPNSNVPRIQWLRRGIVAFALLSLVVNLPNQYILDWITGLIL